MGRTATFDLLRFGGPTVRNLARVAPTRRRLRDIDGLVLGRFLGTAAGDSTAGGSDLRRWALVGVWEDRAAAEDFWAMDPLGRRLRNIAAERWSATLVPVRSHGRWAGIEPFGAADLEPTSSNGPVASPTGGRGVMAAGGTGPGGIGTRATGSTGPVALPTGGPGVTAAGGTGPVAVLTRATVRPWKLRPFHAARGPVDHALHTADGLVADVGMGEWPIGQQATFSLWRDEEAVSEFARGNPTHADVVRRTRKEHWYAEELFTAFRVVAHAGRWDGRDPLAPTVRLAQPEDLASLNEIERAAASRFVNNTGLGPLDDVLDLEVLGEGQRGGRLWVADHAGKVVGFALATVVDGHAHLREIDVVESHGRRGIGRALVAAVCAWARECRYASVTLTTFRDVPWNEPWYAHLGFRFVPESERGPELAAIVAREEREGLTNRTVMRLAPPVPTTAT